jgi:hypothetical protein
MAEKEQGNGMLVDVTAIEVEKGKKICPYLTHLSPQVGGFGSVSMKIFCLACAGEQCGSYNSCRNIQGKKGD